MKDEGSGDGASNVVAFKRNARLTVHDGQNAGAGCLATPANGDGDELPPVLEPTADPRFLEREDSLREETPVLDAEGLEVSVFEAGLIFVPPFASARVLTPAQARAWADALHAAARSAEKPRLVARTEGDEK